MNLKIGRVVIPLFKVVSAIPAAVRKAAEAARDNKDADSAGGAKVTPAEVTEVVFAFVATLGEAVLPAILEANGVHV